MSDENRKPFAEVVDSELHGRPVLQWPGGSWDPENWFSYRPMDVASLRNAARRISEAVEQREAELRGLLSEVGAALIDIRLALKPLSGSLPRVLDADMIAAGAIDMIRDETVNAHEYVSGDVACGLAIDLGIAMGTVEDLALVIETFQGTSVEYARAFLRVKRPDFVPLSARQAALNALGDNDLIAECRRRKMSVYNAKTATYHSPP